MAIVPDHVQVPSANQMVWENWMAAFRIQIHSLADVEPGATIGSGTRIWRWTRVAPTARIGAECSIGQCCEIGPHAWIGDNVRIQNNVSVYEGVHIGSDSFVGPSVVFTNVRLPRAGEKQPPLSTVVGQRVMLGANSTIMCGVWIGDDAVIGAGSVVLADVPAGATVVGNPARRIK